MVPILGRPHVQSVMAKTTSPGSQTMPLLPWWLMMINIIRYLNIGWPASVHDKRVFSNCSLSLAPNDFFSAGEYLLGDSAFSNRSTVVPAFKKLGNTIELPLEKKHFDTLLASARVLSEHTIGIWKGRFPWLRSIPIRILNDRY
jgi:hypothetical protein